MKNEDSTYEAIAEAIRYCAKGLTVYASSLAVKGMDEIVEDMRWLTNWITEFWLTDIDRDNWKEVREQYTNSFQQAVSEAVRTGQAPPLTVQLQWEILDGLEIHAHELDEIGDHDALVDWCRELCQELSAAWEHDNGHQCRRPDVGGVELKMF